MQITDDDKKAILTAIDLASRYIGGKMEAEGTLAPNGLGWLNRMAELQAKLSAPEPLVVEVPDERYVRTVRSQDYADMLPAYIEDAA